MIFTPEDDSEYSETALKRHQCDEIGQFNGLRASF